MIAEPGNLVKEKVVCYSYTSGYFHSFDKTVKKIYILRKQWKINIKILILLAF